MGNKNGPVIGLRVDMDALPIEERTGLDYSSSIQGLMHACGHDLHTCIGLGVAKVLANSKFTTSRIRIIFQPAEEIAQGANWMRAEKVLEGVLLFLVFMSIQICLLEKLESEVVLLSLPLPNWK